MKKFYDKYYIQLNLMFILTIAALIMMTSFYLLLPTLMNYADGTVGTAFQHELENADYTSQVLSIGMAVIAIYWLVIFFKTKFLININSKLRNISEMPEQEISALRGKLFKVPYSIYLLNIILPIIIVATVHTLTVMALTVKMLKLTLILFSFITVTSTACLVLTKRLFTQILAKLPDSKNHNYKSLKLSSRIAYHILPLFIVGMVFTAFGGYSRLVLEKSDALFALHKETLSNIKMTHNIRTYSDLLTVARNINLEDSVDYVFIYTPDGKYINTQEQEIFFSNFFVKYMHELSPGNNGRVYDDYGEDSQAAIEYIDINGEQYVLGIYHYVLSTGTLSFFFFTFIFLFSLNIFILLLFSNSLSSDLKRISQGMLDIVEGKDTNSNKKIPLFSNDEIGDLTIAFNKIQDLTRQNIERIHSSQDLIVEKERLASLGQMIGGIAHNLKTPIMSIAGAAEALSDLIKEYHDSIGNFDVTVEDHHEIAKEMNEWVEKSRTHLSYMSDVITAIKGQAVAFSEQESTTFTIEDLLRHIDILMKHELNNALITLNTYIIIKPETTIKGNINSLVQVVNNIMSNAIQAYGGKQNEQIDLTIHSEEEKIVISIQDYAGGLPDNVKDRIFKKMVTTKGKGGTGLGLFMSYSNIKAHFNGNLRFETEAGKGTTFYIEIPS